MGYINLDQAVQLLESQGIKIHKETLRRAIKRNELDAVKVGRYWNIKIEDLAKWIESKKEG